MKRSFSNKHFIKYNSHTPPITKLCISYNKKERTIEFQTLVGAAPIERHYRLTIKTAAIYKNKKSICYWMQKKKQRDRRLKSIFYQIKISVTDIFYSVVK